MASQRRTDRILFSIPILVQGQSQLGIPFSEISSTIVISRDGGRICLRNSPRGGTELKIKNLFNDLTARFRIAHKGSPRRGSITEWGVALVDPVPGFWGILFEDVPEGGESKVSGLLVCTRCDQKALTSLSPAEYEALGSDLVVKRLCSRCREVTEWVIGVSDEREEEPLTNPSSETSPDEQRRVPIETGGDRRQSPPYAIKIPLLVTGATGSCEKTIVKQQVAEQPVTAEARRERTPVGEPRRLAITGAVLGAMACAAVLITLVVARIAGSFGSAILTYGAPVWLLSGLGAIILGYVTRARIRRIAGALDRLGIPKSAARIRAERRALAGIVMGCFGVVAPLWLAFDSAGFFRAHREYGVNDLRAIESLRTINAANASYYQTCRHGFAVKLSDLGPPEIGYAASCNAPALIDSALASGTKLGYRFTYIVKHLDSAGKVDAYIVRADPVIRGLTGQWSFYTDESGLIRSSAKGIATAEGGPIE